MATKKLYPPGIFGVYLQVRDLDRSLSFYQEALGLKVDWNDGTVRSVEVATGTVKTKLSRPSPETV